MEDKMVCGFGDFCAHDWRRLSSLLPVQKRKTEREGERMHEHKDFIKNTIFTFGKLIKIMLHAACLLQKKKEQSFMGCQKLELVLKRAKSLSLECLESLPLTLSNF